MASRDGQGTLHGYPKRWGAAVPSPVVSLVAAAWLLASRSFPLGLPESGSASSRSRGGLVRELLRVGGGEEMCSTVVDVVSKAAVAN